MFPNTAGPPVPHKGQRLWSGNKKLFYYLCPQKITFISSHVQFCFQNLRRKIRRFLCLCLRNLWPYTQFYFIVILRDRAGSRKNLSKLNFLEGSVARTQSCADSQCTGFKTAETVVGQQ